MEVITHDNGTEAAAPPAVRVETITPAVALEMLEANTNNRRVRNSHVAVLARQITAGKWALNGESIKVAVNGELLDGQHRLLAVVEAGAPIETLVVRGVPSESFSTIDVGSPRRAADMLATSGYKFCNTMGAAAQIVKRYQVNGTFHKAKAHERMTPEEVLDYVNEHPALEVSVKYCKGKKYPFLTPSIASAFHFLTTLKSPSDANEFWGRLYSGAGLNDGSPILALRNKLIRLRMETATTGSNRYLRAHYIARAWNAYRAKDQMYRLRYNHKEPFVELL